jgi:hypothetical protein
MPGSMAATLDAWSMHDQAHALKIRDSPYVRATAGLLEATMAHWLSMHEARKLLHMHMHARLCFTRSVEDWMARADVQGQVQHWAASSIS